MFSAEIFTIRPASSSPLPHTAQDFFHFLYLHLFDQ